MPSGKQILLSLLRTYSQLGVEDPAREEATDRLKAGLLLHGSTAEETWAKVERVAWLQADRSQGLGLARTGILILDVLEALVGDEAMPPQVAERFPELTQEDYEAASFVLWALVSQVCFVDELATVENDGVMDAQASEEMIANYRNKLAMYRKDPDDYLGRPPGWTAKRGRVP